VIFSRLVRTSYQHHFCLFVDGIWDKMVSLLYMKEIPLDWELIL
jgi:hypothetical protein